MRTVLESLGIAALLVNYLPASSHECIHVIHTTSTYYPQVNLVQDSIFFCSGVPRKGLALKKKQCLLLFCVVYSVGVVE